jgi:predicted ArsR family transcriptional regulator
VDVDLGSQAAGIGALADATRRALYEYVVAQPDAVGRQEAAAALGVAVHTVGFHLDRLVEEGLLDVEFRRLTGRSGPGAGRPSKLYRRAEREFSVTLPERRYDLVGELLASAIDRATAGVPLPEALEQTAREEGASAGREAGVDDPGLPAVAEVLAHRGYEPRVEDDEVALANCPFDALAQRHTALVCGVNRAFVQGVADGVGCPGVTAHLEPEEGWCCVRVRPD